MVQPLPQLVRVDVPAQLCRLPGRIFRHRRLHRLPDVRRRFRRAGPGVVSKIHVILYLLRVLHRHQVGQRADLAGAAGPQHRRLDLLPGQRAALHENIQFHHPRGGGVGDHVGNFSAHLLGKILIPAPGPGAAVGVHALAHELVEFLVCGFIRAAAAGGYIFGRNIIIVQVHGGVQRAGGQTVPHSPRGLAVDGSVHRCPANGHICVFGSLENQPARAGHPGTPGHQNGRGLGLRNVEALGAHRRLCLRPLLSVEQLGQSVQIAPLSPAGDVLVADVVHKHPLLHDDVCHPPYKKLLWTPGSQSLACNLGIGLLQQRRQLSRVRADKLVFRVAHETAAFLGFGYKKCAVSFWKRAHFFEIFWEIGLTSTQIRGIIIPSKGGENPMKHMKPESRLEKIKTVVEILAGIANIALVIYTILKG